MPAWILSPKHKKSCAPRLEKQRAYNAAKVDGPPRPHPPLYFYNPKRGAPPRGPRLLFLMFTRDTCGHQLTFLMFTRHTCSHRVTFLTYNRDTQDPQCSPTHMFNVHAPYPWSPRHIFNVHAPHLWSPSHIFNTQSRHPRHPMLANSHF